MADYYSLLRRAIANLPKTSPPAARRAIYDRASKALTNQLSTLHPPLPKSDIQREQTALDSAILRLENEIAPPPPEPPRPLPVPTPELGSEIAVTNGQLNLTNTEGAEDFDREVQSVLHPRLQALSADLLLRSRKVDNTHPDIMSIVSEYHQLIAAPIEKLDVTALWAVGTGLMAISDTYSRLPHHGLMAEPLEPEHLARLKQVSAVHGGFILGFELGRKLTERADQSQVSAEAISAAIPAAHELLSRLSRARDFVEERTRGFFEATASAAVEPSWRSARAGYAVYAVTRDGLIAMGKALLQLDDAAASSFVGGVAIATVAPDLAHQSQVILRFLLDSSQTILSFCEPFPELKFWLANVLEALKKDQDFRSDSARRLAQLGGSEPEAEAPPRRR